MSSRLTAAAVLSVVLVGSACAYAQAPIARSRYRTAESSRVAYEEGYRRGLRQGERDARTGRVYRWEDQNDYQRADFGYRRDYGSVDVYRRYFRNGYAAGYRSAFDGRTGWGRPQRPAYGGYARGAYQSGYADGFEKGLEDLRDGDRFDPLRHEWYRGGSRGYDRRLGSREEYADAYRGGFRAGYERGYRRR